MRDGSVTREFPISRPGLAAAFEFVSAQAAAYGWPHEIGERLSVILDEIVANLMMHDPTVTEADCFSVTLEEAGEEAGGEARMTIRDPGHAFDPLRETGRPRGDLGGHGAELVRRLPSRASYRRTATGNELWVEITLGESPA